jgi:O-antigen/teichoic acid export membrane protein
VAPANIHLLQWSFVVGGVGLFLAYYSQYWLMLSQAHLDFRFLGVLRTGISLLQILPTIPLAWATGNPVVIIGWGATISLLQLGIFVWHARKTYHVGFAFAHATWARAREMAIYTAKLLSCLVVNSFGAVDRLILGRLAPAADFAHFTICANAGGRIQGLSVAVMGPVFSQTNRSIGSAEGSSPAAVYNETFNFTFPWYLLISVWIAVWHPVLLRLWLGPSLAAVVDPVFVPVILASCLSAISNISTAQLGSLNRLGTSLVFNLVTAILFVLAVYLGWHWGGIVGVAWAYLASRSVVVAQDLYVIQLVKADGWLASQTWKQVAVQAGVGLAFSGTFLLGSRDSFWQLVPAAMHGFGVAGWLLRGVLRNGFLKFKRDLAPRPA